MDLMAVVIGILIGVVIFLVYKVYSLEDHVDEHCGIIHDLVEEANERFSKK